MLESVLQLDETLVTIEEGDVNTNVSRIKVYATPV